MKKFTRGTSPAILALVEKLKERAFRNSKIFAKCALKLKCYVRYADDFAILHEDREYLVALIPCIQHFLESESKLQLHPKKVFIKTLASGVDFLGWVHFSHHRVPRTTTKQRMLNQVADCPSDETIASYAELLRHGDAGLLLRRIKKISKGL